VGVILREVFAFNGRLSSGGNTCLKLKLKAQSTKSEVLLQNGVVNLSEVPF
jgi:hypothetical protein